MKNPRFYSLLLCIFATPLTTMARTEDYYLDDADDSSIYFCGELHNIATLVSKISELDNDYDSPLHQLKKHIENGFTVGDSEMVLQGIKYAQTVIHNNYDYLNPEFTRSALNELEAISNQIANNSLFATSDETIRARLKTLLIKKHLEVLGKSLFHKHIRTKHGVHIQGHLEVDKASQFHSDVVIEGTLSVTDLAVANCVDNLCVNNLSVTNQTVDSLSVTNAIISNETVTLLSAADAIIGNESVTLLSATDAVIANLTVTNCMDNLCVNNLTVTTQTIGSISIASAIIGNETVTILSATDAIVGNESVALLSATDAVIGNLTVTNCMANLCVDNLTVTTQTIGSISINNALIGNETVTTLSATDEVINGSLTITPFNTAGVVHNNASGLLSSSLIVNADVSPTSAIVDTKLATISTAGKVANSATTATSTNTPNTIVLRDGSGNFAAGTITAALNGNATTATTATNFSGSLAGDVTGTQSATVVSFVGGQSAANVAAATVAANSGTSANTPNTIVKRGATGNFSAGAISVTDEIVSNTLTVTPFNTAGVVHNSATGLLSSSLIVNADVSPTAAIVDTKLATISTAGKVANSATTATSTNTPNTIVLRDGSGNFAAGTITAALNGNATTATTATNFSGSLAGDVTGTQSATVVSFVGGQSAANVAAATILANAATSANTANTIVKRGATGNFSAGAISVTDEVMSGNLTILPFSTAGVVHNDATGLLSSSLIVDADVSPTAAIVDTKLATISTAGKVANSATTATSTNTPNTIVLRDGSGNFATNMITINGTVTNPTDVATKQYVDSAVGASGTSLATPNTLVLRDGTASFAAGTVSVVDAVASGNLVLSTEPSSSAAAGNIMKGTSSFIHDFGTSNTFVGINSGNFTMSGTGQNVGVGTNTLATNTTGSDNAALGFEALISNTIGARNTAVGSASLLANTTGNNNTAIGYEALEQCTTGSNNTAIGFGAGSSLTIGSDNIYIEAAAGSSNESTTIRIGSSQTACFIAGISGATSATGIPVLINPSGQLGTTTSSRDVKHNIQDMADQSSIIMNLRPVTFAYNDDALETKQYGLIAEEVEEVEPNLVIKNRDNKVQTVKYHILPILLLNEMKKQQVTIFELKELLSSCIARIKMLEDRA